MDVPIEESESQHEPQGSPRNGLAPAAIPEVSAISGGQVKQQGCPPVMPSLSGHDAEPGGKDAHWYVLRVTYGREMKTSESLGKEGVETFVPTETVHKREKGRIVHEEKSLIRNVFFARAGDGELDKYVFDNFHYPSLRYYYTHYHDEGGEMVSEPLIVPDRQMDSFRIICNSTEADRIVTSKIVQKFSKGALVRVTGGPFKGVVGRVARYKGQQRVGVIVGGMLTSTTAFVPNALLEPV